MRIMMKRLYLIATVIMLVLSSNAVCAQSAKDVLDKCAATVSNKNGVQASFSMASAQYRSLKGTIAIKGKKFHASTDIATMWFDGKTQWTYLKNNDEVSVTTPSEAQLQSLNPYNFINMYKSGFKYTMTSSNTHYNVHLTATNPKRKVQELFIKVDKKSYQPSEVKMLQDSKWTTFTITNLRSVPMNDDAFRFNSKDFPTAEVIDLR